MQMYAPCRREYAGMCIPFIAIIRRHMHMRRRLKLWQLRVCVRMHTDEHIDMCMRIASLWDGSLINDGELCLKLERYIMNVKNVMCGEKVAYGIGCTEHA